MTGNHTAIEMVQIATASKVIIPEADAVKFPDLAVESPDGGALHLPLVVPAPQDDDVEAGDGVIPDASLVCLSFRASSQVFEGLVSCCCLINPAVYVCLVCNHGDVHSSHLFCVTFAKILPLHLLSNCILARYMYIGSCRF